MLRLAIDSPAQQPAEIGRAVDAIRRGDVVAIPTDTLYALAADPFNERAVAAIFQAKARPDDRPLPLVAASAEQVRETLAPLTAVAKRLADRFWPGPLTLLLPAPHGLAAAVTAGTGRVGVRVPAHAVARALCAACGHPLTATSANVSGEPPSNDPAVVSRALAGRIATLVDSGLTPGGSPSTIVDVTGDHVVLVRPGALAWEEVRRCLEDV